MAHDPVRQLLDERDIQQVWVRYFDRVDADDATGAVADFDDACRVEIMTGRVYEGREAYARALDRVLAQYAATSHHVSNFAITVQGDTAEMSAYVHAWHRLRETGESWDLYARIVDRLVRRKGRWLVVDHVLHGVDSEPRWERVDADWYRGHPGRRERAANP